DPVVHFDYGVGRYQGLETIETQGTCAEYLKLIYVNEDKIYVPISSLHLISRYTGLDAEHAPLQKLGNKQWDKAKEAALKRIHDVAVELLEIYGKRAAAQGTRFKIPEQDYLNFKASFPFEETPDQEQAIEAVLDDMQKAQPMDRLICGDVGFGKTEVAMRAAFIAVQNSKQVALLVPTTLLASQHAQSLKDRFADWPIKVACLSRFSDSKETQQILADLENGKLDIVVGTHKLLQPSVKFKDLGLLIIDEEHRFGVRQKEKVKALRAEVDILTLTATPIPRTLNMALAGMRDLSIIATPPLRRLSIKTFAMEYNPAMIREALLREIMRGGQVYFLHNDIATIDQQAQRLQEIMPQAKIAIGHGQMSERELERVMADFYHQKYNILLATTIIESGIDVPSANTIIINRADKFGLAQLHQLRGRVGRSHHQAYAYLIVPPEEVLSHDAVKRLEAITQHDELGSGFNLASQDLEIRGAGELLGAEQSGQIEALGFTLFMELLEEAVASLKQGKALNIELKSKAGPEIELGITALLPADYVNDIHARLQFYKRLANVQNHAEIKEIQAELIDRYGLIPKATENLLQITELKLQAKAMKIAKVETHGDFGYLYFENEPKINVKNLLSLIQTQAKNYQLQGPSKLRFKLAEPQQRIETLVELLKILAI
ncbi:MAG TPA: transcription-repair coupling factor, partial [Coxiellaceae bacterium]|nr:transcription-repair coupling factor [Coxiellaceae bacterium]